MTKSRLSPRLRRNLRSMMSEKGGGELAKAVKAFNEACENRERLIRACDISEQCQTDSVLDMPLTIFMGTATIPDNADKLLQEWIQMTVPPEIAGLTTLLSGFMDLGVDLQAGTVSESPLAFVNFLISADDVYLDLMLERLRHPTPEPKLPACELMVYCFGHKGADELAFHDMSTITLAPFRDPTTTSIVPSPDKFLKYLSLCNRYMQTRAHAESVFFHARVLTTHLGIASLKFLQQAEAELGSKCNTDRLKLLFGISLRNLAKNRGMTGNRLAIESLLSLIYPEECSKMLESLYAVSTRSFAPPPVQVDELAAKVNARLEVMAIDSGIQYDGADIKKCIEAFRSELETDDGFGLGMAKLIDALNLSEDGMIMDDAIFLVNNVDDAQIALHARLDAVLDFFDLNHEKLHFILSKLNAEDLELFSGKLHDYSCWMDLMPGSQFDDSEKMLLSAALALHTSSPPGERKLAAAHLKENEDAFIEGTLSYEADSAENLFRLFEEYQEYSERFVRSSIIIFDDGTKESEVFQTRKPIKPHKKLLFSKKAFTAIKDAGITVDDMRIALVYGLRLTSGKRAVGGRYFPVQYFRNNCEALLSNGDMPVPEKRALIEKFLLQHGVISIYRKNDGQVRLNIKEDGYYTEPSEVGHEMLDNVLAWLSNFKQETI